MVFYRPLSGKQCMYFFPPPENSEDSPQRMRTRNKTKEQTTNNRGGSGTRSKRGGNETPEPKAPKQSTGPSTPDKQSLATGVGQVNINTTPNKKNKSSKPSEVRADTPHKRKRQQDGNMIKLFELLEFTYCNCSSLF